MVTPLTVVNNRLPRTCPGRRFALRTLYIVIACALSAFNIEPALDEDGNSQPPKAEFNTRFLRYVFLGTSVCVLTIVRRYIRDPKPFQMCNQASIRRLRETGEGGVRYGRLLSGSVPKLCVDVLNVYSRTWKGCRDPDHPAESSIVRILAIGAVLRRMRPVYYPS